MWNGYFYSNQGWLNETNISDYFNESYGIEEGHPVLETTVDWADGFRWSIFKYTYTPSSTFKPYKVLVVLGNDNNINLSNLKDKSFKMFINTGNTINGVDNKAYYWLNISYPDNDITDAVASGGQISYEGSLIDSQFKSNAMDESNFLNSSLINISGGFTENFSNPVPKKLIGARINQITLNANETHNIYIAIGVKNTSTLYYKKPELYMATGNKTFDTKKFS
jgi:hypothetical protein